MTLQKSRLAAYLDAFDSIEGMFSPDAAVMFLAYNQLIAAEGIAGDTLEIGVHHGLSAVTVAWLRAPGARFVAVDLFEELQSLNLSRSGAGEQARFLNNLARFHGGTDFIRTIAAPSASLSADDLGRGFSFCHIDGGHSAEETRADLALCSDICLPGGLIALDDYFNPAFPGVSEGAVRFLLEQPDALLPVAIGYNKVIFQKRPTGFDIDRCFASAYPQVVGSRCVLWGQTVRHFTAGMRVFFDLEGSAPGRLVASTSFSLRAELTAPLPLLEATSGETVLLPVRVRNLSSLSLDAGASPIGVSYHLLGRDGDVVRYDNRRRYLEHALAPGEEIVLALAVEAPSEPGSYQLELDLVWEGVCWFKDRGSETSLLPLLVTR